MELFNEYYSSDLQFLLDLFSLNRPFSRQESAALAKKNHVYTFLNHENAIDSWLKRELFEELPGGQYRVCRELYPFVTPPNRLEAEYLADICASGESKLFLSQTLLEKLEKVFPTGESSALDFIKRQNTSGKKNEATGVDAEVFRLLLRAIHGKREIAYDYCTNSDLTPHHARGIPYRLEYSVFDGRWWLISYNAEQDRPIKSKLDNILRVEMAGPHSVDERTICQAIERQKADEPVILRITNEKNALERCFLTFEGMLDMTAFQLGEDEYELRFNYFKWDRHVIVRKLLYLGEYVVAQSPDSIVKELVEELKQAVINLK